MKRTIFILIFLFTFKCYAQSGKILLKQGGLIFLQTWVAKPIDSTSYKLEIYAIIKEPFLFYEDTLYKEPKFGDLIGDSITIKCWNNKYYQEIKTKRGKIIQEEFVMVDSCDKVINNIKNQQVYYPIYDSAEDTARKYIGYNGEYYKFKKKYSLYEAINTTCPFDFKNLAAAYEKDSYAEIQRIYAKKLIRKNWFAEHIDSIDTPLILDFINSFDESRPDAEILNLILLNKPLLFLKTCEKLSHEEFDSLRWMLDNLPKEIGWANAIAEIEAENFTPRKGIIVRALKKNLPAPNTR